MKIFLCADIEGTAGITDWAEAEKDKPDYQEFRELMTGEVLAACEGARAAGASEVVIKDAHDSGRNILIDRLPSYAKIIRGWSGHPDAMMFGINEEFDAAIFTGHHAKAGSEANPLAHTTTMRVSRILLNGEVASEHTFNALCAARYKVPVAFLSGDKEICSEATVLQPKIQTVATSEGFGRASLSIAPVRAREEIFSGVKHSLEIVKEHRLPSIEGPFELTIEFVNPTDAYRNSWYPGAYLSGPRAIGFRANNFFEVQRALRFLLT